MDTDNSMLLGKLLVAAPSLSDPRFDNALVWIIEHSLHGAIGLIINRPSLMSVDELTPEWDELGSKPGVIFGGGPVDHDALITLGRGSTTGELPLGVHSVDLDEHPAVVASSGVEEIRIFSGYVGWVYGQLEDEISDQGWWVVEPRVEDLFTQEPASRWTKVLQRQSVPYNWYAHYPEKVRLN